MAIRRSIDTELDNDIRKIIPSKSIERDKFSRYKNRKLLIYLRKRKIKKSWKRNYKHNFIR